MQLLADVRQVNRGGASPHHCRRSPPGEHQHPRSRQSGTGTHWTTSAVNTTSTCTSTTSHRHTLNDFSCQCSTHHLQVDCYSVFSKLYCPILATSQHYYSVFSKLYCPTLTTSQHCYSVFSKLYCPTSATS